MNEIKSVRIRNKMHLNYINLDIKITLYDDGSEMVVDSDNKTMQPQFYKKNGFYSNYTNDEFIKEFINSNSKLSGASYEIIQDPWTDKAPLWRSYGFDPYYLNNGASILITWTNIDGFVEGGRKYSDDNGNEINEQASNTKIATIIAKDDKPMHFTKNNEIELKSQGSDKQWGGLVTDKNIVNEIIERWNNKIPGYGLDLCSPDNQSCFIIEYKSPLVAPKKEIISPTASQINQIPKIKMNVIIPDVILKVKNDLSLKVYIGQPNKNYDKFQYDDSIPLEYQESDFNGISEGNWKPMDNGIDDEYDGDSDKGKGILLEQDIEQESFIPASKTQKDFIRTAVLATLSNGSAHGKCARYVANHANNYIRLLQNKNVIGGAVNSAGGNANQTGYHNNLKSMGFKSYEYNINKDSLINKIKNGNWEIGDIIAYWCVDGSPSASHVRYGHTQIYTGGYHNNSTYRWSTDNINNYGTYFVYRSKSGNNYKLIIFKAPKSKAIV